MILTSAYPLADQDDDQLSDDDFALDLRLVEAATPMVIAMCDTSDQCGATCGTSACSTGSYDPI